MGRFLFIPDSNKKYHIKLSEPYLKKKYPLPNIHNSGRVLQLLSNGKEELRFKVAQSSTLYKQKVYLRIQLRGTVYSMAVADLKDEAVIKIPLKGIPKGIAEVTLFNNDFIPIAERLVFVNHDQKLHIKTSLNKDKYYTRGKVHLKINVTDQNGKPVPAHLGISVYDKIYQNEHDAKTIESHYHLSSQLKGKLYNPSYYFNPENKDRKKALDLLLITQGWRSYQWAETNLKAEQNRRLIPVIEETIKGKVNLERINKKVIAPVGNHTVMANAADSLKGLDLISTDSIGRFAITPKHLKIGEDAYLYIKPMTPATPKYLINIIDKSFEKINTYREVSTLSYPLKTIKKQEFDNPYPFSITKKVTKLDEVVLTTKKKKVYRDKFIGKLYQRALDLEPEEHVCCAGHLNCIYHCVPIHKPIEGEKVLIETNPGSRIYYQINYYYSHRKKKYTEDELIKMFNLTILKGYYGKKEFYKPVYDIENINDPFPDVRNTLFWKPNVLTNSKGEATVEFFCSDLDTPFIGNIEGVGGDRLLGAKNFELIVTKKVIK